MSVGPEAVPADDQSIGGERLVLRRIPPRGFKESDGRPNSSPNFELDQTGRGTSVTIYDGPEDLANVLRGHEGYGAVSLPVAAWRSRGLTIARDPQDGDPNHCEVWGRRSTGDKRALAKQSRWEVYPEDYPAALITDQDGSAGQSGPADAAEPEEA